METGLVTMARQIIFAIPTLGDWLPDVATHFLAMLGSPPHILASIIMQIETATNLSTTLVNMCTYSMILQTGEEMDREMAQTLPWMDDAMKLYGALLIPYTIVNPMGGLVGAERNYAFAANRAAYQAILDYWNASWEWKTTVVTEVIDGDTIHVAAYDDPIRVQGINCPETCHQEHDDCDPADEKWAAGYAAKDYATTILLGTTVTLRAQTMRGHYDRIIAKVFLGDWEGGWEVFGTNMVRAGHAKFYTWSFPTTLTH